jgi:hypothetical protein
MRSPNPETASMPAPLKSTTLAALLALAASAHAAAHASAPTHASAPAATHASSILFIGNSFTYAQGSAVHYYRASTVTDLNQQGVGGLPALFKSFTAEAGLKYDVFLETQGGVGLDWHLEHKSAVLGARPWDSVVMHGLSTLDGDKPGDPALLVDTVRRMSQLLRKRNPAVELRVMETWPRADQTYPEKGHWHGQPIDAMAGDLHSAYDKAQAATPGVKPVIPVGDAWMRAMRTGVADPNPYDGIEAGKLDLWTYDHYHASTYGYYLEALVVFGSVTGRDPRSLGDGECSGYELGLSREQVAALEQVAFDQLATTNAVQPAPAKPGPAGHPDRCATAR